MSIRKTMITVVLTLVCLLFVVQGSVESIDKIPTPFEWELVPAEMPRTPGLVDLNLNLTPTRHCRGCSTVVLVVTTQGGLEYLGPVSRTVPVEEGVKLTEVFSVNIPPNEMSGIRIMMNPNGVEMFAATAWFVASDDSVEFWKGHPQGRSRLLKPTQSDRMRKGMTPEQLKGFFGIRFDLKNKQALDMKRVLELVTKLYPTEEDSVFTALVTKEIWASLHNMGISCDLVSHMTMRERLRTFGTPEQLKEMVTVTFELKNAHPFRIKRVLDLVGEMHLTGPDSIFTARVTRDVLMALYDLGISPKVIDQPTPPQPDSSTSPSGKPDSSGQQGWLDQPGDTRLSGALWLDTVVGLTSTGKLPVGETIKFYLGMTNNTSYSQRGISNGFRVYSPDGAGWSEMSGNVPPQ